MFMDAETKGCVGKDSRILVDFSDGEHQGLEVLVVLDYRPAMMSVILRSE